MNFKVSFTDPFEYDLIDLGKVEKDKIMETFEKIPWSDLLAKMAAEEQDIVQSPHLEVQNPDNKNVISVSAVDETEWYIFFKRPKLVTSFFGLSKKFVPEYESNLIDQTIEDVRACLQALINNDVKFLEEKFK